MRWLRYMSGHGKLPTGHFFQMFTSINSGLRIVRNNTTLRIAILARVYQPRGADAAPSRSGRGLLKIQAV